MAGQIKYQDIAKRYALAFFNLAKEQSCLDLASTDFQKLELILSESRDFQKFINNTTLHRTDQVKVLTVLSDKAEFNVLTQKFLGLLAMKRRLNILPKIVSGVREKIANHKGEITAGVTAAYMLEPAQMNSITTALEKTCGMTVKVKLKQDTSIVGGLVIKIGSMLIDNSIKGKLKRLHRVLKNSSV